jgi:hypothetical protein
MCAYEMNYLNLVRICHGFAFCPTSSNYQVREDRRPDGRERHTGNKKAWRLRLKLTTGTLQTHWSDPPKESAATRRQALGPPLMRQHVKDAKRRSKEEVILSLDLCLVILVRLFCFEAC